MLLTEISDGIWVTSARPAPDDARAGVVAGADGVLVVGSSQRVGAQEGGLAAAVAGLGRGPVQAVILTHVESAAGAEGAPAHDLGAVSAVWPGAQVLVHEDASAYGGPAAGEPTPPPRRTFSAAAVVDLGGRLVEVVHPGGGHGVGAAVVRVADADVVWVGALVAGPAEAGGEGAVPDFGTTCRPLAWPSTLDVILDLLTPSSVVVPGHGHLVDRGYVEQQRNEVGLVSQTLRDLAAAGVPAAEALQRGDWPYPREQLAEAVRRGYDALPRGARQLPRA